MIPNFENAKYVPQETDGAIVRTRMLRLLDHCRKKNVVMVIGCAAQGKTTLVSDWIKMRELISYWFNCDSFDSDFCIFEKRFLNGLKRLKQLRLLKTQAEKAQKGAYQKTINTILQKLPQPCTIVFDNLDQIDQDSAVHEFLTTFINAAPLSTHFIFLSRSIPKMDISVLSANNKIAMLTNDNLSFSLDETRQFFQLRHTVDLNEDQLDLIYKKTEGWAGGLTMLSEWLKNKPRDQWGYHLQNDISINSVKDLIKFFDEEIFCYLSEKAKDCLIDLSIYESIGMDMVDTLPGLRESLPVLDLLNRHNGFVYLYKTENGQCYKFHELFRAYLLSKFRQEIDPLAQQQKLSVAGTFYSKRGQHERALIYYIQAEKYLHSAAILKNFGMDCIRKNETNTLRLWIRMIPESCTDKDPWLKLFRAIAHDNSKLRWKDNQLEDICSDFEEIRDKQGLLYCLSLILESRLGNCSFDKGFFDYFNKARRVINKETGEECLFEFGCLVTQIGIAMIKIQGQVKEGMALCETGFFIGKKVSSKKLQIQSVTGLNWGYAYLGIKSGPLLFGDRFETWLDENDDSIRAEYFISLYTYRYYCFANTKIEAMLDEFKNMIGHDFRPHVELDRIHLSTLLLLDINDRHQAEINCSVVKSLARSLNNRYYLATAFLMQAQTQHRYNMRPEALANAQKALQILIELNMSQSFPAQQTALFTAHNRSLASPPYVATLPLKVTANSEFLILAFEMQIAESYRNYLKNQLHEATQGFLNAFQLVRNREIGRLGLLSMDQLIKICQAAACINNFKLHQAIKHFAAQCCLGPIAYPLVKPVYSVETHSDAGSVETCLCNGCTATASPFCKCHQSGNSCSCFKNQLTLPPVITVASLPEADPAGMGANAQPLRKSNYTDGIKGLNVVTLGGFGVFRGDKALAGISILGSKPFELLKAVLCHGATNVLKDKVIDNLWPECSQKAAENNFRVNLYRLRNYLEPRKPKNADSSYIFSEGKTITINSDFVSMDFFDYLELVKLGDENYDMANDDKALRFYEQAVAMYKGDFLANEPYHEWMEPRRLNLQATQIQILERMAELHEQHANLYKASECLNRLLHLDPIHESAYQQLMMIYYKNGQRSHAIKTFRNCEYYFKTELNTQPADSTTGIYQCIRQNKPSQYIEDLFFSMFTNRETSDPEFESASIQA